MPSWTVSIDTAPASPDAGELVDILEQLRVELEQHPAIHGAATAVHGSLIGATFSFDGSDAHATAPDAVAEACAAFAAALTRAGGPELPIANVAAQLEHAIAEAA